MSIQISCKCGEKLSAEENLAGGHVKCPLCGTILTVPVSGGPQATPQASSSDSPDAAPDDGYAMKESRPANACPSCGAEMASGAIMCIHCGYNIQLRRRIETKSEEPGAKGSAIERAAAVAPSGSLPDVEVPARPPGAALKEKFAAFSPRNRKLLIGAGAGVASIVALVALVLLVLKIVMPSGYATPQEVFEAQKAANLAKDWKKFLGTFTPDAQDQMLAVTAWMALGMSAQNKEAADLLKKHGIDAKKHPKNLMEVMGPMGGVPPDVDAMMKKMEEEQKKLVKSIRNKPAFFAGVMDLIDQKGKEMAENLGMSQEEISKADKEAKLHSVEIDGDSAVGKRTISLSSRTFDAPVYFRKVRGSWLVHLPTMKEMMEGMKVPQNRPRVPGRLTLPGIGQGGQR